MAGSGVRVSTVQPSLVDTNLITSNLAGKLSSLSYSNLIVRQKLFQLCLPFASQARTLLLWRNVRLPWREWPETSSTLKTSREPFSSCLNSPSIFPSQVFLCTHVLSNSNKSLLSSSPLTIVKVYDVKKYSSLCIVYWWKPDLAITSLQHSFIGDKDLLRHDPNFLGWHSTFYGETCGQFWTEPITLSVFSIERRK